LGRSRARPWPREAAITIGLAVVTAAAFARVAGCGFVNFDDPLYVTENPHVLAGLGADGARWAFGTFATGNWHPLTWLSHLLDVTLFGVNAGPHHLVNLLLHVLSTCLLFGLLARATGAPWRSAAVAALFGVHPLRVESVAWIAERKDVLSTLLSLATLALYARAARRPGRWRLAPALGVFALALLAKPMAVTLPLAMLLLDAWPLGRFGAPAAPDPRRRGRAGARREPGVASVASSLEALVAEKVPFLVLAALSAGVTFVAQRSGGAVHSLANLPFGPRLANALVSYVAYVGQLLWPARLCVFYPFRAAIAPWAWIGAALLLAAVTALVVWQRGRRPWLAVGWLWYVGTLVPVIGLVQVGSQAMADRYTYLPSIGLAIALVWGLAELLERLRVPVAATAALAAAALAALAVATSAQVGTWTDSFALYRQALAVTKGNAMIEKNLGVTYQRLGRLEEALPYLDAAVRDDAAWADARFNRGLVREGLGRLDDALRDYAEAARLQPLFAAAHRQLGAVLFRQGRFDEALAELQAAVRWDPADAEARDALGATLATKGRYREAEAELLEALRLRPDLEDAARNLERLRALAPGPH
jgi:protein O-mannosyl-transferase